MSDQARNPIAGKQARQPYRTVSIYSRLFASVDQGEPIPVVYGTAKVAGTLIMPVWGFRAEEIKTNAGGK